MDATARVAAPAWSGCYLDEALFEPHRVVVGDAAVVVEATDGPEVRTRRARPVGGLWLGGLMSKALTETWEVGLEDGVGLIEGAGARPSQLLNKAVLEGAPAALDSALGLRGASED